MVKGLLEKMVVTQLVKKVCLYGIRIFITMSTRAYHWTTSWANWIQCPLSRRSSPRRYL